MEIGYFDGEPHEGSDLTLASLATIFEKGKLDGTQPARFPMEMVADLNAPNTNPQLRTAIRRAIGRMGNENAAQELLDQIGTHYREAYKNLLGNSSRLLSNAPSVIARKGVDAPGVETGELRLNAGYRTSLQRIVRK